jgi:hypothetical protein
MLRRPIDFGDVRGLLTSLATEGFTALERATSAAAAEHEDPVEQLVAIGEAYVDLARTHAALTNEQIPSPRVGMRRVSPPKHRSPPVSHGQLRSLENGG